MKGNFMYEDVELYNKERKERFLKPYLDQTQKTYRRVFYRSSSMEEALNKDLSEFNLDEIENVLFDLSPLTASASRANVSTINSYINWAIEEGHRTNNINPLSIIPSDWYKQFIDKNVMIYSSKSEIDEIINECVNAQDGVLFSLLFNGVDVHSICNLMKKDVNYDNNTLTLRDKEGHIIREGYEVDSECIRLIRQASNEEDYLKKNGEADENSRSDRMSLTDNDYVVRAAATRKPVLGATAPHVIYRRLSTIAELWENPYLRSKNIFRSGQIYYGYLLYKRDSKLDKDQYFELCQLYNISKIKNGNYETYNYVPLKEYINLEIMQKLGYQI